MESQQMYSTTTSMSKILWLPVDSPLALYSTVHSLISAAPCIYLLIHTLSIMAQRVVAQRLSLVALAARSSHRHRSHCCATTSTTFVPSRGAWIHSTRVVALSSSTTSDRTAGTTTTTTTHDNNNNNDDECPIWQNPLHHNNPELEKMFPEDFNDGEEMPLVPLPPLRPKEEGSNVLAPEHIHQLADEIVLLNMMEMKQLMDKIATHFGFDPHSIAMGLGGNSGSSATRTTTEETVQETVVEKTTFDLKLISFDTKNKIKVIKEVRAVIAGLGLKEAKELVEGAPTIIKKDIKREEAEELQKKLQDVGATMDIV